MSDVILVSPEFGKVTYVRYELLYIVELNFVQKSGGQAYKPLNLKQS